MNSELRELILKILSNQIITNEEFYFLKHECLWVLISFSMAQEDVV